MTSDTFTANPLKTASSSEAAAAASSLKIQRSRRRRMLTRLGCLIGLVVLFAALYQFAFVNPKFFSYAMSIRLPRLIVLLTAGTAISAAAIIFQTIIRNNIVTPCLLGMNSLYLLIHTGVVFFLGSRSEFATNPVYAFAVDIIVMGTAASFIYYSIFQKTGGNVLYVLLIGTVLTTFFSSMQNSLTRIMDPNEYDALLNSLVASFTNVNAACIIPGIVLLALLAWWLRRDLSILDVISLGREQAISLGVDYETTLRRLMVGVALCIAVATALVGPLSFLGLITANVARQMFTTYRHTYLIAGASLVGMLVLAAGQFIVEHVMVYSVPVSVFVTIGGGIYFLYLILTQK
ncbi:MULTISPECIES: iron chelate uptake ABC transporter family permease subunit [Sutterella]|jgi:hypothetical protein|uniref:iron chelate uptake ABC transporter family permease subunit n=1 Tax=Sutterella TaxID=40544 RepID=UPI00265D0090|nr:MULTISPECIES: iron chelate uptake ABC transporter family permease subunit [Sutterella]MDR3967377.1 iron chelate uptake ABC transporter family permease subunit [Sutterella sp.]